MYLEAAERRKQVVNACNKLLGCESLSRLLRKLLAMGNMMNTAAHGETARASGITLASLIDLTEMRGVDQKTSILDVVVRSSLKSGDVAMLRVVDDLKDIGFLKVSSEKMERDSKLLNSTLQGLRGVLKKALTSDGGASSDRATELSPIFAEHLDEYIRQFESIHENFRLLNERMSSRVVEVVEYFGEDPASCSFSRVLERLSQFIAAVQSSRIGAERELRKA